MPRVRWLGAYLGCYTTVRSRYYTARLQVARIILRVSFFHHHHMSTSTIFRPCRFRIHSDAALGTAHTIAQLAKYVTAIANIPFASQAASLVLSVLEIVKVSSVISRLLFLVKPIYRV